MACGGTGERLGDRKGGERREGRGVGHGVSNQGGVRG